MEIGSSSGPSSSPPSSSRESSSSSESSSSRESSSSEKPSTSSPPSTPTDRAEVSNEAKGSDDAQSRPNQLISGMSSNFSNSAQPSDNEEQRKSDVEAFQKTLQSARELSRNGTPPAAKDTPSQPTTPASSPAPLQGEALTQETKRALGSRDVAAQTRIVEQLSSKPPEQLTQDERSALRDIIKQGGVSVETRALLKQKVETGTPGASQVHKAGLVHSTDRGLQTSVQTGTELKGELPNPANPKAPAPALSSTVSGENRRSISGGDSQTTTKVEHKLAVPIPAPPLLTALKPTLEATYGTDGVSIGPAVELPGPGVSLEAGVRLKVGHHDYVPGARDLGARVDAASHTQRLQQDQRNYQEFLANPNAGDHLPTPVSRMGVRRQF